MTGVVDGRIAVVFEICDVHESWQSGDSGRIVSDSPRTACFRVAIGFGRCPAQHVPHAEGLQS
jgi:hypothetical protein